MTLVLLASSVLLAYRTAVCEHRFFWEILRDLLSYGALYLLALSVWL